MKKIVAFGASSSKESINKALARYALSQVKNSIPVILDLNDFEMPIYGIDREKKEGIPKLAFEFKEILKKATALLMSDSLNG